MCCGKYWDRHLICCNTIHIDKGVKGNVLFGNGRTKMATPAVIMGFQGGATSVNLCMYMDFNHARFQEFTVKPIIPLMSYAYCPY